MENCIIDAAQLASSMKINSSLSHSSRMSPKHCIFTVPTILSRHNKAAYIPTAFSIGPLHYNDSFLKHTHNIKIHYLNDLVKRVGIKVEDLIAAVAEIETEARHHYGEALNLSPSELVEILVLDGCFIIELFRKYAKPDSFEREYDDPVFSQSCMRKHLLHDLMLLENQIPWMVLEILFNLTEGVYSKYPLALLTLITYQDALPIKLPIGEECEDHFKFLESMSGSHILHLLRNALLDRTNTPRPVNSRNGGMPPIHSVTGLKNRGIRLKKWESGGRLTIEFEKDKGVLYLSPIRIDDTTEALFRNIIAFEQCSPWCYHLFTSYAILLDNLINTTEDLEELRREEIITYMLNPDDALKFFNKLYIDTSYDSFYYGDVCTDINDYCRHKWPQYRAILVQNYFSNPWVTASTFAAITLLVLTLLQTLYAIKN